MARKKTETAGVDFKQMKAAATEINSFMDPEEGDTIKTVGVKSDKLKENLLLAAKEFLDPKQDKLTQKTMDTLTALGANMKKFKVFVEAADTTVEPGEDEEPAGDKPPEEEQNKYIATAQELNTVLELVEQPIVLDLPEDELKAEIVDVCKDIEAWEFESSAFLTVAHDVFKELDIEIEWKPEEKEKEVAKPAVKKKKASTGKATEKGKGSTKKESVGKKLVLKSHEYANLFPDMSEDDLNEIVKDMNENGFRTDRPIILFGGKIADGKNRYKAASIAGVDATFINFDGTKEELFKHVVALNLKRRHLTPAQRATLAAELLPEFEKAGKKKQGQGGKGKKTEKPYRATEAAAKATGTTKEAVTAVKKIKKESTKTFNEMKQGKKTIAQGKRETEKKSNVDLFNDAEKMLKAKFKIVVKSIHDFIDAAELAEKEIEYQDNLDLIESTISTILN